MSMHGGTANSPFKRGAPVQTSAHYDVTISWENLSATLKKHKIKGIPDDSGFVAWVYWVY